MARFAKIGHLLPPPVLGGRAVVELCVYKCLQLDSPEAGESDAVAAGKGNLSNSKARVQEVTMLDWRFTDRPPLAPLDPPIEEGEVILHDLPVEELKAKPQAKTCSVLHQAGHVVLGVLILWQLFYLAVANGVETLQVVTRRSPNTNQRIVEVVDASRSGENASSIPALSKLIYVVDKWGQVSQQPQRWSLFAPNVGKQTGFLTLEFKWETMGDSLWLYSEDEPENPASYLRSGGNRFRSVEQNLVITFSRSGDESEQNARERWGRQIRQKLAVDCDCLMAWIGIRLADFQRQHPHVPTPDEIVIHSRGYEIPTPDQVDRWDENDPYCIAIARWRPTVEVAQGVLPIEAFDPVQNRFVYQPYATETAQ